MITVLFFGDVIGKIGRRALKKVIPPLKKKFKPDLIIANGENLAHGSGITPKTLDEILRSGVDLVTSGNHFADKKEVWSIFKRKKIYLLRPANYPPSVEGEGEILLKIGQKYLFVINLMGRVFINETLDDPFRKLLEILAKYREKKLDGVIVDFHAEATSEKVAFGYFADGKVSAVIGTHTHVPTIDNKILPQGTGYISDVGMVGAYDSVIGWSKERVLERFTTQLPILITPLEKGLCQVNSALIKINPKNRKCNSLKRVDLQIEI